MNTLISPKDVIAIAFAGSEPISESIVNEAIILSAEQKFIAPVFGALYPKMCEGAYADFLNEYVKAPLAYYVKMLVLPSIAAQTGNMGVSQLTSGVFAPATPTTKKALLSQVRMAALSLIKRAIEQIESNPAQFPEYKPSDNIFNRVSLNGHIVI